MLSELGDGHELEENVAQEALPAVGEDPPPDGRDDTVEGIEQAVLSGIDGVKQGGCNSLSKLWLSIESHPGLSREKRL